MTSRYCLNSCGYIPHSYIPHSYIPRGCIPCLDKFNANLVYYVDNLNEYIESGKLRKLFDFSYLFNVSPKNHSGTQTDTNYISVDCEDCETNDYQINDWDIV